jgi:hypothetical protein
MTLAFILACLFALAIADDMHRTARVRRAIRRIWGWA